LPESFPPIFEKTGISLRDFAAFCDLFTERRKMEKHPIPWEAIAARLNLEADAGQLKQIQNWLDSSADNRLILEEITNTWSLTGSLPEYYQPDMARNWDQLVRKIRYRSNRPNSIRPVFKFMAAAAIAVMVFLAGLTSGELFRSKEKGETFSKVISPKGNKTRVVLPDGSLVWLNSGSELWYSTNYTSEHREVWMKGECYFQVEKDPVHPLLVHGSNVQLKVFGTTFNLREDEGRDLTDVTLLTGKVSVYNTKNEEIAALAPGQELLYQNGTGRIQQAENSEALTSWINNILIFKNQPFEEVIRYLNGWYGVDIHLDRTLYYRHNYTFKIKTESLREVLELISIITPINYTIEGDQVKIKYKPKM
jgi:ferric-dicitrate binding protein FerR (iron transport regulator)